MSTSETIVRWHRVGHHAERSVGARLKELRARPPSGVPRLLRYGLTPDGRARLELERVAGKPLQHLHASLRADERGDVARMLRTQLDQWKAEGFIHGDLSPRNILVERCPRGGHPARLWFIDWTLDLQGRAGTPRFAAPEVFLGRRGPDSDRYSIERILCIVMP